MFSQTLRICARMSPLPTISPVGSRGSCPAMIDVRVLGAVTVTSGT